MSGGLTPIDNEEHVADEVRSEYQSGSRTAHPDNSDRLGRGMVYGGLLLAAPIRDRSRVRLGRISCSTSNLRRAAHGL